MTNTADNPYASGIPSHGTIHAWANPPTTPFPLRMSPVRIAIGTPNGPSTNSWKVWVHRADTYVACRDNFREIKVSLHASGNWRVGFTEHFANYNPDSLPPSKDRVWKKWRPTIDDDNRLVIGFQIVCPTASLYLAPKDRTEWPTTIVFVEAPPADSDMAVLSVCVVLGHDTIAFTPGSRGAVIAVLPLDVDRTIQVVVTHENVGDIPKLFTESFRQMLVQLGPDQKLPDNGIFFLHGNRGVDIPWVGAVPYNTTPVSNDTLPAVQPNTR